MSKVRVTTETEAGHGWAFEVVIGEGSGARAVTVLLSWVDYDYWCGGSRAPAEVVSSLVSFMLEREEAGSLRSRFDASRVRRRYPEVDAFMRAAGA